MQSEITEQCGIPASVLFIFFMLNRYHITLPSPMVSYLLPEVAAMPLSYYPGTPEYMSRYTKKSIF